MNVHTAHVEKESGRASPLAVALRNILRDALSGSGPQQPFSARIAAIPKSLGEDNFASLFVQAVASTFSDPNVRRQLTEFTSLDPATDDLDAALHEFILPRFEGQESAVLSLTSAANNAFDWRTHMLAAAVYARKGFRWRADVHHNYGVTMRTVLHGNENTDVRDLLRNPTQPAPQTGWIAFVSPDISVRALKIASTLRKGGKRVRLFTRAKNNLDVDHPEYFDAVHPYENALDLWAAFDGVSVDAVHCFARTGADTTDCIAAFAMDPFRFVLDIKDLQDIATSPIVRLDHMPETRNEMALAALIQRFLLNHSRHVCARVGYNAIHRSYLPNACQQRIYLPEMAWGHPSPEKKLSDDDGKLHVVHGGSFLTEKAAGADYASLLWLAERAEKFDVHFHLYARPWNDQDMSDYEALAARSPNFHNHGHVPYAEWIEALKRYDVGMFYIHPDDESHLGRMPRMIDPSGAWGNKFGDFVDGDLFMVISRKYRYMTRIAQRYGVGEGVSLDQVLQKTYWDDLKGRVLNRGIDFSRAKTALDIHAHAPRLCRFYERIETDD